MVKKQSKNKSGISLSWQGCTKQSLDCPQWIRKRNRNLFILFSQTQWPRPNFNKSIAKGNMQDDAGQDSTMARVFSGIWVLLWLFETFFFYYLMVFTIAVTCAFWYYNVQWKNSIITAYKWIYGSAIGSITFAALVIAIITLVRMIVDTNRRKTRNIATAVCLCLVSCLLKTI